MLCEPVEPPKGELEHMHYFCGNTEIASELKDREPQRNALYQATVALVRAYANIADELGAAGYSATEIGRIKQQVDHYLKVRKLSARPVARLSTSRPTRPICGTSSTPTSRRTSHARFHPSTTWGCWS